ncbi:hypothetical protein F511_16673 [Dorcoceras hygrometricum]|uniref:Secreted protein n=1 Tax=Dorcoceras hygrometricum TaxID=472368 RepID=A0A2Z7CVL4_9LAMI|nr:hypothetical protein F511_16673 [Dorcoceras hygrometricum]
MIVAAESLLLELLRYVVSCWICFAKRPTAEFFVGQSWLDRPVAGFFSSSRLLLSVKSKRCRVNLFERHHFDIIEKYLLIHNNRSYLLILQSQRNTHNPLAAGSKTQRFNLTKRRRSTYSSQLSRLHSSLRRV